MSRLPPLLVPLVACALAGGALGAAAGPIVVSQQGDGEFRGDDETPIQAAIDAALKRGGGEILIRPGTYPVRKGIVLEKARRLAIRGADAEAVILKLPSLSCAEAAEAATAGASGIRVRRAQNLRPGMTLHFDAEGAIDSFTGKPKPYVLAKIREISGERVSFEKPLEHPIPEGAAMRDEHAPNLIEIRAGSGDILIEKLTLDGGRTEADPPVRGHAQLCGVFATGPYDYEKGPTGPPVEGIMISRCILQNFFGRGIAFYSVKEGFVLDCTIRDTCDEAVDFDHFTVKSAMQGCHVARCRVGIELNDANDCLVQRNDFLGCDIGINLWRWCRQEDLNRRNAIRGNLFEDTKLNAIQIAAGTSGNLIEDNEIDRAGRNGIALDGEGNRVAGNRIRGAALKAVSVAGAGHAVEDNSVE